MDGFGWPKGPISCQQGDPTMLKVPIRTNLIASTQLEQVCSCPGAVCVGDWTDFGGVPCQPVGWR